MNPSSGSLLPAVGTREVGSGRPHIGAASSVLSTCLLASTQGERTYQCILERCSTGHCRALPGPRQGGMVAGKGRKLEKRAWPHIV